MVCKTLLYSSNCLSIVSQQRQVVLIGMIHYNQLWCICYILREQIPLDLQWVSRRLIWSRSEGNHTELHQPTPSPTCTDTQTQTYRHTSRQTHRQTVEPNMQIISNSFQIDNHQITDFYGPYAPAAAQPTSSKHWRQMVNEPVSINRC